VGEKIKCWEFFDCNEKECPVYKDKELMCWLVSGTHCRNEIQGKFLEKIEMCLECEPFRANIDVASMEETLGVVNNQFIQFRNMVEERDRELESISIELAVGLSEVFDALKQISSGDPSVRISETSELELLGKLKNIVNQTAKNTAEIVGLSHEFAMGLAEHFDALLRVSKGDLSARVYGTSEVELLEALKKVTNQMIGSVSREITDRTIAEEQLKQRAAQLERSNKQLEEFAHVISHDLQEPLRTVSSHLRLLARQHDGKTNQESKEFISLAVDGVNRMYRLIDHLLENARVNSKDRSAEPTG
jgi:signal transduction histidine kinase